MTNATLLLTRCPSLVSNSNRAHWTMGAMLCSSLTGIRSESSFGIPPPSKSISRYTTMPCHAILAKTKEPSRNHKLVIAQQTAISPKARMSVSRFSWFITSWRLGLAVVVITSKGQLHLGGSWRLTNDAYPINLRTFKSRYAELSGAAPPHLF